MANVKFSRKEFEKHCKITKEIEEKIAMFGTPLESLNDNEVEIEIFPNRPDLLSLQGYLRSFLQFLGKGKTKEYKVKKSDYKVIVDSSVKDIRPCTACCVIKNLKFDNEKIKEIIDIQEKLHITIGRNRKKIAIGIYPLEKIKFPIRFEAKKPEDIKFVPLESEEEMTGKQILARHPAGRDYASLLEGKEKFPVFIDSNNEILSMPPIINSQKTGKITGETKEVFIECSGFDLQVLKKALNILACCFSDMGGDIYTIQVEYGSKKESIDLKSEKFKIKIEDCNNLLGLELKESELKKLLEKMGYEYKNKEVFVPAYRADILHPVDIYEDVAIAYGYDKLEPELPEVQGIGEEDRKEIFKRKISEILSGLGMLETSSYALINEEMDKKTGIKEKAIKIKNALGDYNLLRKNMLSSSLKILGDNVDSEYPQKIFELGLVFRENDKEETGIEEKNKLVASIVSGNFTDIKQILDYLFRMLNLKYKIEEDGHESFIEGRTAKILHDGKKLGILGEIKPEVLKNWHIKMPLACLELDVDELIENEK